MNMKAVFNIDGEPSMSYIGKKPFEDKMRWGPMGELILTKTNKEDGMVITATRYLKGNTIHMVSASCLLWD